MTLKEKKIGIGTRLQELVREQMNLKVQEKEIELVLGAWYLISDGRIGKLVYREGRWLYFCTQDRAGIGFVILVCYSDDLCFYDGLKVIRKLRPTPGKTKLVKALMSHPAWNKTIKDEAKNLSDPDPKNWAPCIYVSPHILIKPRSCK